MIGETFGKTQEPILDVDFHKLLPISMLYDFPQVPKSWWYNKFIGH